jgi:hypothetical protein
MKHLRLPFAVPARRRAGIHYKGWTRNRTIRYILDNSSRGRSNATAETERYIAMPGHNAVGPYSPASRLSAWRASSQSGRSGSSAYRHQRTNLP